MSSLRRKLVLKGARTTGSLAPRHRACRADIYYSAGKVGIGVSNPSATREVNGSASFGGAIVTIREPTNNSANSTSYRRSKQFSSGTSAALQYMKHYSISLGSPFRSRQLSQPVPPPTVFQARELPLKLILFFLEQHVKCRQRPVRARDVLLHLHLFRVTHLRMRVDLLFQHAQIVSDHHDLVEQHL